MRQRGALRQRGASSDASVNVSNEQPTSASEVDLDSLAWARGSLNDSSFKALCKLAARAIDTSALREVLEEISARIHDAGDHAQKRKLVDQPRECLLVRARQRAIEILCGHAGPNEGIPCKICGG